MVCGVRAEAVVLPAEPQHAPRVRVRAVPERHEVGSPRRERVVHGRGGRRQVLTGEAGRTGRGRRVVPGARAAQAAG